jgi:TIR domain-containing protein
LIANGVHLFCVTEIKVISIKNKMSEDHPSNDKLTQRSAESAHGNPNTPAEVNKSGTIYNTEYFDVFISYKRDKGEQENGEILARKLNSSLKSDSKKIWFDRDDIGETADWYKRIEIGILHSKKVAFVLSPEWFKSKHCQAEFKEAFRFKKRIIPIIFKSYLSDEIYLEYRKAFTNEELEYLGRSNFIEFNENSYETALKKLTRIIDEEPECHDHTQLLCESYYWEQILEAAIKDKRPQEERKRKITKEEKHEFLTQHKDPRPRSMLLKGSLTSIKDFKVKCDTDQYDTVLTDLQNEFIKESRHDTPGLNRVAYLNVSSNEANAAEELNFDLKLAGISTWYDQPKSEDPQKQEVRDREHIEHSRVLLNIRTAASEDNPQVQYARSISKKIITVTGDKEVYEKIKNEAHVHFWSIQSPGNFEKLTSDINDDAAFLDKHARFNTELNKWKESGEANKNLLSKDDAEEWKQWYNDQIERPNFEQSAEAERFIQQSEIISDAIQKRKRMTTLTGIVAGIMLVVFGTLAILGWQQKKKADDNLIEARDDKRKAERSTRVETKLAEIATYKADVVKFEADEDKKEAAIEKADAKEEVRIATLDKISAEAQMKDALDSANELRNEAQIARADADTAIADADTAIAAATNALSQQKAAQDTLRLTEKKIDAVRLSLEAFELTREGNHNGAKEKADDAVALYEEIEEDYETDILYNTYYSILKEAVKSNSEKGEKSEFVDVTSIAADELVLNNCSYSGDDDFDLATVMKVIAADSIKADSMVYSLVYSNNGNFGALGLKSGNVILFKSSSKEPVDTVKVGNYRVTSMGFNQTGNQLVASTVDDQFRIIPLLISSGIRDSTRPVIVIRTETFARIEEIEYLDNNTIRAVSGVINQGDNKIKTFKKYPATVKKMKELLVK